jgi:GNAT superfamily N-acetyltransferase
MISFQHYTISDLKNGVVTHDFAKSQIIPLSPLRLTSYCHNPAARDEDFVLFTARVEDECIAFRTVLPDFLNGKDGQIRVAWFSGNWVRDDFRRMGISTRLFLEIKEKWGDFLIFTNYAPASQQLYLKTGAFKSIYQRKGIRLYLNPPFKVIAQNKGGTAPLKLIASVADKFATIPFKLLSKKHLQRNPFVIASELSNDKIPEYLSNNLKNSLSSRSTQEFQWIFGYGWLEKGEKDLRYPFSWRFTDYEESAYIIKNEDNINSDGIMIVRFKDYLATVPFYFAKNRKARKELFEHLIAACMQRNIVYLTVYHPELTSFAREKLFLKKTIIQHYYATDNVIGQLPTCNEINFQDGDGEAAFV